MATRMCIGGHSGRRRGLIPLTEAYLCRIDRVAALRNAEKLLRQGKLEPAIAEYLRIVEDSAARPEFDQHARRSLRARRPGRTRRVEQFLRIAGDPARRRVPAEGGSALQEDPQAQARPRTGAAAGGRDRRQPGPAGRRARVFQRPSPIGAARAAMPAASRRSSSGSARSIRPISRRGWRAAAARVDIGELTGAVADLKDDRRRTDRGRPAARGDRGAAAGRADRSGRRRNSRAAARTCTSPPATSIAPASARPPPRSSSRWPASLEASRQERTTRWRCCARPPASTRPTPNCAITSRGRSWRAANGRRRASTSTAETAGSDPQLLLMAAELQLRGGNADEGMALVRRCARRRSRAPRRHRRARLETRGRTLRRSDSRSSNWPPRRRSCRSDWASAAAALQEFVTRVPEPHPRADAAGRNLRGRRPRSDDVRARRRSWPTRTSPPSMGPEARFIAEDLVAREPWERANIERFRRSLVMLGEPDPDGVIAERLSGQTPFMSTDRAHAARRFRRSTSGLAGGRCRRRRRGSRGRPSSVDGLELPLRLVDDRSPARRAPAGSQQRFALRAELQRHRHGRTCSARRHAPAAPRRSRRLTRRRKAWKWI